MVELKKINIGDIVPFFIRSPRFEGLMTGRVKINDPFGDMTAGFVTQIDQFRFENDSIGILKTSGSYTAVTGDIIMPMQAQIIRSTILLPMLLIKQKIQPLTN